MSTIYLSSPTSSPPNPLLNSSSNQYSLSNTDDRDHPMMMIHVSGPPSPPQQKILHQLAKFRLEVPNGEQELGRVGMVGLSPRVARRLRGTRNEIIWKLEDDVQNRGGDVWNLAVRLSNLAA
ncbi:hypothetical protein LINPERPRIM_LOCUS505 [Linum perenne]